MMNIIINATATRLTLLLSLVALCFSGTALAHVKIKETSPVNKAQLSTAPQKLVLTFEHPNAVTKLTLTDVKGNLVNFNFTANSQLAELHTFPLPSLSDGHYTVSWAAIDKNGNKANDSFAFTIGATAKQSSSHPKDDANDDTNQEKMKSHSHSHSHSHTEHSGHSK